MKNIFEGNEIKIILGFFVLLFVVSVLLFSYVVLQSNSKTQEVNLVETESYSSTLALVNNSGITSIQIGSQEDPASSIVPPKESPVFPSNTPDQSYVIPETGYFDKRNYLYALLALSPFVLIWVLFRRFAVKNV